MPLLNANPYKQPSTRFIDLGDVTLSNYLDIEIDVSKSYVAFEAKIGDFVFKDKDDVGDTNILRIMSDIAEGGILQKTTKNEDGTIWEMDVSSSLSGAVATVDLDLITLDGTGIEVNDNAANPVTLRGLNLKLRGLTETAIGLSALEGINIDMPTLAGSWNQGAAIVVSENVADMIVSLIDRNGHGLSITGEYKESRTWMDIRPSVMTLDVTADIILSEIDLGNITINDNAGAETVNITASEIDLSGITVTSSVAGLLGGQQVIVPPDSVKQTLPFFTGISTVHLFGPGTEINTVLDFHMGGPHGFNAGLLMMGESKLDRDWLRIHPQGLVLDNSAVIRGFNFELDQVTINDGGVETPIITGFRANFNDITETAIGNTRLRGIDFQFNDLLDYDDAIPIEVQLGNRNNPCLETNGCIKAERIRLDGYAFEDHFHARTPLSVWATRVTTGAVGGAPSAGDQGGVCLLQTGAITTNEESLDFDDIFTINPTRNTIFEARILVPTADVEIDLAVGLVNTDIGNGVAGIAANQAGTKALLLFQVSNTVFTDLNFRLHSQAGGVSTILDTAVLCSASTWYVLRAEICHDNVVRCYIDNTLVGTINTNIPAVDLQPMLFVLTRAAAARDLEVDYVKIWQELD